MIKHLINFAVIIFLGVSCSNHLSYDELAEREIFRFAKDVQKSDHLELIEYGGGFLDQINTLTIGFLSRENVNIDQARWMFVNYANMFIDRINCSNELRPYLAVYPFTIEQLKFSIIYRPALNPELSPFIFAVGTDPKDDSVCKDDIFYMQESPRTGEGGVILRESYYKALNTLRFQLHQRDMEAELQAQECL